MTNSGIYWALTGVGVFALALLIALGTCWLDDLMQAQQDRRQDRREGWTEPPSRLDRLDGVRARDDDWGGWRP